MRSFIINNVEITRLIELLSASKGSKPNYIDRIETYRLSIYHNIEQNKNILLISIFGYSRAVSAIWVRFKGISLYLHLSKPPGTHNEIHSNEPEICIFCHLQLNIIKIYFLTNKNLDNILNRKQEIVVFLFMGTFLWHMCNESERNRDEALKFDRFCRNFSLNLFCKIHFYPSESFKRFEYYINIAFWDTRKT